MPCHPPRQRAHRPLARALAALGLAALAITAGFLVPGAAGVATTPAAAAARAGTAAAGGIVVPITATAPTATRARKPSKPPARPRFRLRAPDGGGPAFYRRFKGSLPADRSFFPIGVWLQRVATPADVRSDRAAGINTYVALTPDSDLGLVTRSGMRSVVQHDFPGRAAGPSGWFLSDEVDLWAGAGDGAWTGNWGGPETACVSAAADCGFTVQRRIAEMLPKDGRLRWANYGKGVLFWQPDAVARRFVNEFQDIVSVDAYWSTDNNLCGTWEGGRFLFPKAPRPLTEQECRRPSNYGAMVDRARALVAPAGSKPVWAFVELGHPSSDPSWPTITPSQVEAAVWSSLIHGARGITYFNHSFGGPCVTTSVLRDPCYRTMRATVTALNAKITRLAPVLNGTTVANFLAPTPGVDTLVKVSGRDLYVVAQSTASRPVSRTLASTCRVTTKARLVGTNRTVPVTAGRLTGTFSPAAPTQIYVLPGAARACGIAG